MLLAIDTSAGTSVAVVDRDRGVLAQADEADTRRHAEVIGTLIERVLAEAGVAPRELSGVVAGMGPGPFTGLRVGIAAARAFAFGVGRPVVPLVSHDALALDARQPLLVVTDARRREVAWSTYAAADELGLPVRMAGPRLAGPEELESAIDGYAGFVRRDAAAIPAGQLGMLGERLFAAGRPFGPTEPLYLRPPDVTPLRRPEAGDRMSGSPEEAAVAAATPTPEATTAPIPAPTLRRATVDDLDAIMRLETSTFASDAWSRGTMRAEVGSRHGFYLVAEAAPGHPDAAIAGYAGLLAPAGSGQADIQTIAVAPDARRRGLGRALMVALLAEAREREAREVFLEVRADNPGAEALYVSLGFEQIAVRPNYYQPDGVDAHIMKAVLS